MSLVRAQLQAGPPARPPTDRRNSWWIAATLAWLVAVGGALGVLWRYQRGAGAASVGLRRWPAGTTLSLAGDRPTIVQMVHPRCPCSRASLSALRAVSEGQQLTPAIYVVFLRPSGMADGWAHTESWEAAARIPGARLIVDRDGREAARFGALTSGQTFAFSVDGSLTFSGGITVARGEEGDSVGRRQLETALGHASDALARSSRVYGCSLAEQAAVP